MFIKFPEIERENYAQLRFIKKHRQKGNTRYIFYDVNISEEVSKKLKEWLLINIKSIKQKTLKKYNPSTDEGEEIVDLSKVDKWNIFKENALKASPTETKDLNTIKRSLTGFIIYVKTEDSIIGQIRKIFPKSILNRKGLYKIFFRDGTFNEIREDIGLQVDNKADLIFIQNSSTSNGIVINKENFKSIFDMHEQEKREAVARFGSLKLLSKSKYASEIKKIIDGDRQIQTMLINPTIDKYANSVDYETLKKLKQKVGNKVAYELDDINKDFILPDNQRKKALKDIIKTISGRYNQDLKGEHVMESTNVKRLLK